MSLNNRVTRLEDIFTDDDGPSLAQRLTAAIEAARERQRLGLPKPKPPEGDDPLSQRLRRGWELAQALRQQFGGGESTPPSSP
jgi:hypothetical protein